MLSLEKANVTYVHRYCWNAENANVINVTLEFQKLQTLYVTVA